MVQGLSTEAHSGSVTVEWDSVTGATGYNIFWAQEPYIDSDNIAAFTGGDWEEGVNSPYTVSGLTNGQVYFFVVTATAGTVESDDSVEVSATPRSASEQNNPSAQEVLMIELINRARFDPTAEAARYGIDLNQGLSASNAISPDQKPPLAHNRHLMMAARDHSQWMLNTDTFNHIGEGGSSPSQRMTDAGYNIAGPAGENIAVRGTSASSIDITAQIAYHHEGLFESPGHRQNILREGYGEIGVGQQVGTFYFDNAEDWYLSSMLTENFASSGSNYFVTGVIYNDSDGDSFYDVGEGLSNITVDIDGDSANTAPAGNYTIGKDNGTYTITVSGAGIPGGSLTESITVSGANRKFDVFISGGTAKIHTW